VSDVVRPDDVRRGNRGRVISAVRTNGLISRTDIGRETGLSAATVSTIASDLIAERILVRPRASGGSAIGRGRPKVALAINPRAALVGVAMFQINHVAAAIIDYAGNIVGQVSRNLPTLEAGPDQIRASLSRCLDDVLQMAEGRLSRIAVAVQGVTDIDGTKLLWSPVTRARDLPIGQWLEEAYGVPASVSNDCDQMARALNWREADVYGPNFAAILLSHGVGMGLFLHGRLINGTRSSASEFGHMVHIPEGALCRCGRRGCIEAYAGDYAIARAARGDAEDTPPPDLIEPPDIAAIAGAARAGDGPARAALAAAGRALGTGLAGLYALVDPFPVALIGGGTAAFDLIEQPLRDALGGTMGGGDARDITIDCYPDERPLVLEGCAVKALLQLDGDFAATAIETQDA
jgi:predicted NBD/HSP70 family sugar kinase